MNEGLGFSLVLRFRVECAECCLGFVHGIRVQGLGHVLVNKTHQGSDMVHRASIAGIAVVAGVSILIPLFGASRK